MTTAIGLHIPKCAGSSIIKMAKDLLPSGAVYQNTSFLQNWIDGNPEFLEYKNIDELSFVWGHSIHEEMIHKFNSFFLFTCLRDPVERLKSEVIFAAKLRRDQGRGELDIDKFLQEKTDPMCWFIIDRFPTIAGKYEKCSPFEKAQRVLESFNYVFFVEDVQESIRDIFYFVLDFKGDFPFVGRENPGEYNFDLNIDVQRIENDIKLFQWAVLKFGKIKMTTSLLSISSGVENFMKRPPKEEALRIFLMENMFREFSDFGCLHEVVADRLRITELHNTEISYYVKRLLNSSFYEKTRDSIYLL
ncbi:sulfotransferase family protein [Oceanibaculum pacificum]|uniref:sulfotransferase family 2 domain-containing protein n=1 Tax=Oceanibaculum pacificum TaxID=580166 RepID=UPI0012EDAC1A|nr:sulfotransferase family 2 domain-containing protein [Oceanibaculum pacificum]